MPDDQRIRRLHNDLKARLAIDYLHPTVNGGTDRQRFLMNCRDYLTTPREQAIENVVNVLDIFEQKGIMSPGEYGNLKEVVRNLNVEILELIREAEDGIRRIREGDGAQNTESRENASYGGYICNARNITVNGGHVTFGPIG